jgi:hypothetical protein
MNIHFFCTLCVDTKKKNYEISISFTHWNWYIRSGECLKVYALGPLSIVIYDNEMIGNKTAEILDSKE